MSARIYLVIEPDGTRHLIRGASQQQARSHVARHQYHVNVASQDDIVSAMQDGVKVVDANQEPIVPETSAAKQQGGLDL